MELNDLLQGMLGEIRKICRSDAIVGKPMKLGEANLVPLCRVSIGFGAGTSDLSGSGGRRDGSIEGGGAGGGIVVEPRAFVVVARDGVPQLLTMRKGMATLQHPIELPVHEQK
jgi:uncharacterized spore protein YtfJ